MAQSDLDYIAPEIQMETGKGTTYLCDMFSLGMTICAIYNNGRSLIQATHSTSNYVRQIDRVSFDVYMFQTLSSDLTCLKECIMVYIVQVSSLVQI